MEQLKFFPEDAVAKRQFYRIPIVRVQLVREKSLATYAQKINSAGEAYEVVKPLIGQADREYFLVLCLDTRNKINAVNVVSVGTVNVSPIHPREVFKAAILANATSVILAHNHPSGDPEPSPEDIQVTGQLVQVGKILGIEVLDHIIVGDEGYFTFKRKGLI